ncbi:MAG: cadherin-like domain-containing protein, partial [Aquabacterium sp.]|uniref:beta strand repeat-containing protein n=1 Tax=Aquabacterium sp. TaxID=1872578 RepID=UPI002719404F
GTANGGANLDTTARTMTLNVTSVNDAPTGASTTITTLEDTAHTFTAADFGFTDANDTPGNTLLSVRITTLPGAGSLTLNGVAVTAGQVISAADIASDMLVYTPGADDNGAGYASFTFQVQDNGGTVNGGVNLDGTPRTMTVNVMTVNDAPEGTDATVTTLEDATYTFTAADFGFADPNDAPGNAMQAVRITTLPSAGSLTLNGVAVSAGDFISAADIASGLLVYTPGANDNGTGYASFTFQVQDDGGTANGGVNLDATPRTMTVTVTSVNDAPVGTDTTVSTHEDTSYTFTAADFGFTDANDSPGALLQAIRITTLPSAGGLTLNGVAVSAGDFISAADIAAGLLVYTPGTDEHGAGYASFTFQVQDDGGTANGGANLDTTARTMTVNVSSVNDAPTGASTTITTLEDTAYVFTAADFGFSDLNDAPGNTLLGVMITNLPASGSLTLSGVVVTAGQVISAANISSGLLVYTPGADGNGAGYTSFSFQVQDDGGTANGGVNLDVTPRTVNFNITAVNDAPMGSDKTVSTTAGNSYIFGMADFGFTDLRDAPANAFWSVGISTLPGAGSLTLNGAAVNAGDFVLASDIAAGKLMFTPVTGASGAVYASFTFQVMDDGGTALAGSDTDVTARRMTIAVTSAEVPGMPGTSNPGSGPGTGTGGGSLTDPSPESPTTPPSDPKDDTVDQIGDKLEESAEGATNPPEDSPLPPVQGGEDAGVSGQAARATGYSSSYGATHQGMGFAFRLEAGGFNLGLMSGNLLQGVSINPVNVTADQDLNLSFSNTGVNGSGYAAPSLMFTETAEDRQVKVEKMVVQTSGAALSIGAVWWAARMSGLLASLMISTPAWRSIDPLPVMGLGEGKGPDDDDDGDEQGDDPSGMDARAARLFGANKFRSREIEGIG